MENILQKLKQLDDIKNGGAFDNWTLQEKKQLLDIYYTISKQESYIFDLIYMCHGCDSWEDIFRDYSSSYLDDKTCGVQMALDEIERQISEETETEPETETKTEK